MYNLKYDRTKPKHSLVKKDIQEIKLKYKKDKMIIKKDILRVCAVFGTSLFIALYTKCCCPQSHETSKLRLQTNIC